MNLGGGVEVRALLDAATDHPAALPDAFPGATAPEFAAFPETVGAGGRWHLPVYCYLVRTSGAVVLVDAGVGPAGTAASEWLGVTGALAPGLEVDLVVFTHLHRDHVGWAGAFERLVVSEREWATARGSHLEPLRGRIETAAPGALVPGVELVALPGHTPGHCGVRVRGTEGEALLLGDTFNHPLQLSRPDVPSGADGDRAAAAATRREVLERLADVKVAGTAHFPGGWVTPDRSGRRGSGEPSAA